MTTRERRAEYSSSNVVRVLSPTRPLSPNPPEYDNNLEYLLEDLQHSISRPGSSVGQNQSYTRTERDVQYLSPSNTSTIIRERSRSPNTEAQRVYKTATYEYSTSGQQPGNNDMMQQNIHQLDTLLSDLNSERDSSLDRNRLNNGTLSTSSNLGIDSGLLDPIPTGGGTTKIIKQTTYTTDYGGGGKPQVQRELLFESPDSITKSSTLDSRSSRTRQRSPDQKYYKTIEKTVTRRDGSYPQDVDSGLYGGINRRPLSPPQNDQYSTNTLKTYNYSTTTNQENVVPPNVPYNEVVHVETTQGDIPLPLKEVQLSDDILPKPATKVTTTVRTYTYEIPADPQPPPSRTVVYKNESYDTTTQGIPPHQPHPQQHPRQPVNQTIIYKNESHTTNTNVDYPGNQPPYGSIQPIQPVQSVPQNPPGHPPGVNKTIIYKKDTRETTTNLYPGNKQPYPQPPNQNQPIVEFPPEPNQPNYRPQSPPVNNTTIIYRENVTDTKNTHHHHPPPAGGVPVYPSGNPPSGGHPVYPSGNTPPQQGPKTTYYYKHESSNTTNTHYGPGGPNGPNQPPNNVSPYPNDKYPKPTVLYPTNGYPPQQPNHPPHQPNDPTIIYNYSTTTRTNNINHGYPHEKEPLLQPTPFPTDGLGPDVNDGGNPPKRLDDLMATFGDTSKNNNYNNGPYPGERPLVQHNNQTALAAPKPTASVEPKPSARNIQGPAVYYPPGKELFAQNSGGGGGGGGGEMQASSYRAQGGYAKGSGKYMYESESRSKSKSSSGAAVVPVCLPLCCAMPCVLM